MHSLNDSVCFLHRWVAAETFLLVRQSTRISHTPTSLTFTSAVMLEYRYRQTHFHGPKCHFILPFKLPTGLLCVKHLLVHSTNDFARRFGFSSVNNCYVIQHRHPVLSVYIGERHKNTQKKNVWTHYNMKLRKKIKIKCV